MLHQNGILTIDDFLYSCHLFVLKRDEHCYENLHLGHHL